MIQRLLLLLPLLGLIPPGAEAQTPSFECTGNLSPTERLVCIDPMLSNLDDAMATLLDAVRARVHPDDQERFRRQQATWRQARDRCGPSPACVGSLYGQRITELRDLSTQVSRARSRAAAERAMERVADVTVRPDGAMEKPGPQGNIYRREPDGTLVAIGSDGTRTEIAVDATAPHAALPPLPNVYGPWVDSLNEGLNRVLGNLLTPSEMAIYRASEASLPRDDLAILDWRLRTVDFLTNKGGS